MTGRAAVPTTGGGTDPIDAAAAAAAAQAAQAALGVQRALAELRGGRAVELRLRVEPIAGAPVRDDDAIELLAVEAPHRALPTDFIAPDGVLHGLIAAERAACLGHPVDTRAAGFTLDTTDRDGIDTLADLASIAGLSGRPWRLDDIPGLAFVAAPGAVPGAALALARESSLAPALLWRPASRGTSAAAAPAAFRVPPVHVDDVLAYPATRGRLTDRVSSAHVPLAGAGRCEFVVYRERFGEAEHVAVVVGTPERDAPVTVRIHSACFTGDLFASMKCDCGEQLRGAVTKLARDGGGVILYLAQEGRGIGLANKLRAYSLQERGMDTIDADRTLGFGSDHRDFTVARTLLADLGIERVRLVTNNPRKIAALEAGGIEVVARIPSIASINPHNAHYLETKRDRAGHLFGPNVLAAVGE